MRRTSSSRWGRRWRWWRPRGQRVWSTRFDPAVVRTAQAVRIPILPGVATPSEVQLAMAAGLTWVKAFPAAWLGPSWFRHIRGPFPQARFVATGGIDTSTPRSS